MKKTIISIANLLFIAVLCFTACVKSNKISDSDRQILEQYHSRQNIIAADSALAIAIATATAENKNIFVQIGGEWCVWCRKFNKFVNENDTVNQTLNSKFVYTHLTYNPRNEAEQNRLLMRALGNPQRFGFPVFLILNKQGEMLHIQNTAYLESGDGYDTQKVCNFLLQWTVAATE
jgi:thiol:disulfide interchange protein